MLVIYNPSPLYDSQRDFWRRTMKTPYYFIKFDTVDTITLEGDTLLIPGIESYEGIITKTLDALEYFLQRDSYDFIIRTNISSIWDYPRLITHLSTLPSSGVYSGLCGGSRGSMNFVSGSGIIFTPDVCMKLLGAREFIKTIQTIDDVDIGFTCEHLGIPVTHGSRQDIIDDTTEILPGFYHYRVRLLNNPLECIEKTIKIMQEIKDQMI